ncbi:TPA: hypothetical protein ACTZ5N_002517 [Bacillus cereus]
MEVIGSLTKDIRSLCVVIHLPVQEKLEQVLLQSSKKVYVGLQNTVIV